MTFSELLQRHPALALDLVRRHRGNFASAEQNWRELERQLMEKGVQAERARAAAHVELYRKSGDARLLLKGVASCAPADAFVPFHVGSVLCTQRQVGGVS